MCTSLRTQPLRDAPECCEGTPCCSTGIRMGVHWRPSPRPSSATQRSCWFPRDSSGTWPSRLGGEHPPTRAWSSPHTSDGRYCTEMQPPPGNVFIVPDSLRAANMLNIMYNCLYYKPRFISSFHIFNNAKLNQTNFKFKTCSAITNNWRRSRCQEKAG